MHPRESESLTERERAELRILRDWAKRALGFDGWTELMTHEQMHRHHADEPYIGCVFCHDKFVPVSEHEELEAEFAKREAALKTTGDQYDYWLTYYKERLAEVNGQYQSLRVAAQVVFDACGNGDDALGDALVTLGVVLADLDPAGQIRLPEERHDDQ